MVKLLTQHNYLSGTMTLVTSVFLTRIKTGWSTISSHHHHRHAGLTAVELKQIQQVLERAQAMEHLEEVRIG